ncbi:MAG: penicillin-binding protein 1A [Sterolibacteriaceae bacterium]|nr:penicillin-binding protein 1A [Sterolibacteriaceae bacterium]MBK9086887.1 penicillin-binding protein 1A [Sterolibacteriaceae bacterium]
MRWILYPVVVLVGLVLLAVALGGLVAVFAYPNLPSLDVLTDYRPKIPLRVYTADGYLIGEFGEERRNFVRIQDVPPIMKQAILAAEDERFYQHPGVDTIGVMRAAWSNFSSGGKRQGASTITMQVARNFFLSSEKTVSRKLYEALLSFKIENNLSKDEILQLYINQIYLGQRAYGFSAAAHTYFGKELADLSIAEAAMLAGLPKAPSAFNPVANPKRAAVRQQYVLRRMHELRFVNDRQLADAQQEKLHIQRDPEDFPVRADYVAEMARQIAYEHLHEDTYSRGAKVVTTITRADQMAAYAAARKGVMDYDRRHGYRGAEAYFDLGKAKSEQDEALDEFLQDVSDSDELRPAVVLEASRKAVRAYRRGGEVVTIGADGLKFAAPMLDEKAPPNKRLRRGALIRILKLEKGWEISQLPEVEVAFVSANPQDGSVRALIGGFDFERNKFNHVTQAWRQPGSSFKPFIYSAALEKGYAPSSVVDDSPIAFSVEETGSQVWEPKNYDGRYDGPMTLRTALARSKNMVSIRLLKSIGTRYAQDYVGRFGFEADRNPPYLTMALGAGSSTPWHMLSAYSVFANGGYKIEPYIVKQIVDGNGKVLAQVDPPAAGDEQLRVIDARNAYLIDSMMHDVVRRGTATRALSLKRADLAGKTGTTNEYIDAWFCGYQPTVVGIAWIGFDQPRKLGTGETGGSAALPIWVSYMDKVLKGVPESIMEVPEGLTRIRSEPDSAGREVSDLMYKENLPAIPVLPAIPEPPPSSGDAEAPAPAIPLPPGPLAPTSPSPLAPPPPPVPVPAPGPAQSGPSVAPKPAPIREAVPPMPIRPRS